MTKKIKSASKVAKLKTTKSKKVSGGGDKISADCVVSIHYTVKDEKGVELDSSIGEEPLFYLNGHGQIIKGLEKALNGKSIGDKMKIEVSPKDGYGVYDSKLVAKVSKDKFPPKAVLKVGEMFHVADKNGNPAVARITEVKGDQITMDGNHPFAGKTLSFSVEVVGVREASKEELEHGHAHGPDGHGHH